MPSIGLSPTSKYQLFNADCLRVLPLLSTASVDAIVTDPPAGIAFMGKEWDSFKGKANAHAERQLAEQIRQYGRSTPLFGCASHPAKGMKGEREAFIGFIERVFRECLRIIKPGCYALVWAIPRTSHWTATALENAGFEIRDRISHLFGTGFPKGKGCLKPACEDWWFCRAPGRGVKPLGIDECRIGWESGKNPTIARKLSHARNGRSRQATYHNDAGVEQMVDRRSIEALTRLEPGHAIGRWPANLVLSHHDDCGDECHEDCPVRMLDKQSGERGGGLGTENRAEGQGRGYGKLGGTTNDKVVGFGDSGSASRFFYCPKASKRDRGEGNTHPTVKNTDLMAWLTKLVCPNNGVVLDPFMGSGSTGVGCLREARRFIGIEREKEYYQIAEGRLKGVA